MARKSEEDEASSAVCLRVRVVLLLADVVPVWAEVALPPPLLDAGTAPLPLLPDLVSTVSLLEIRIGGDDNADPPRFGIDIGVAADEDEDGLLDDDEAEDDDEGFIMTIVAAACV